MVSVIIPTYNCCELLPDAIESALGQTYPELEVLVIDDGSTDATAEACATFGDRVRYVRRDNGGTAAARNTGLRLARGEFVALLDHDDQWEPDKIRRQVEVAVADEKIGMVCTGGRVVDLASGRTTSEFLPPAEQDYHRLLAWCDVTCASTLLRRSTLDEVGGFDESVPGVDDWDLWIRIAWQHRVVGVRQVLTTVREHGQNQGHRYKRMYPIVRRVIDKARPLHPNCVECRRSMRTALALLRDDYYAKASRLSRHYMEERKIRKAVVVRIDGLMTCPKVLLRRPMRVLKNIAARLTPGTPMAGESST